jgi:hypothetical protein
MRRRSVALAAAATLPLFLVGTGLPAGAGPDTTEPPERSQPAAVRTTKGEPRPTALHRGKSVAAPNPYLALVPDPSQINWSYWRSYAKARSAARADARLSARAIPVLVQYDEKEPVGTFGLNDTQATRSGCPNSVPAPIAVRRFRSTVTSPRFRLRPPRLPRLRRTGRFRSPRRRASATPPMA